MFDSDEAMVRIDMSEFMETLGVSSGWCASGYVGYEGGYLTEAVSSSSLPSILLDEVESGCLQHSVAGTG